MEIIKNIGFLPKELIEADNIFIGIESSSWITGFIIKIALYYHHKSKM